MSAHGSTRALTTVAWLRERIAVGDWPLDSQIPTENQLAETLKVGRSTVREAVRTLANQGMLETARGRGTFVRARTPVNSVIAEYMSSQRSAELLQLRRALEVEAAGLAAERRTDDDVLRLERLLGEQAPGCAGSAGSRPSTAPGDFHADIFDMSGNELMGDVFRGVLQALRREIATGALQLADPELRHEDHLALTDRIRAQDVAGAREVAALHCQRDIVASGETSSRRAGASGMTSGVPVSGSGITRQPRP